MVKSNKTCIKTVWLSDFICFQSLGSHTSSSSTFSINGKTYAIGEAPTDPGGGGGGGLEPKISRNKDILGQDARVSNVAPFPSH